MNKEFKNFLNRLEKSKDTSRVSAMNKRHDLGYRTARENLNHLVDQDSFLEFGEFAVAAQRTRRDYEELQEETPADGIITGFCKINADQVGESQAHGIAIVYDYSVLAGTQGFFHHQKLDRITEQAERFALPIVIYTEGGGGRPGDVDVTTQIAGLNIPSFSTWARLSGRCLKIAIANGYCFAGNAALFGCSDFRIATKNSWIGMAGPAMIEGGGLGIFDPKEIGPSEIQEKNGVIDYLATDEEEATSIAKKLLSYFQGPVDEFSFADQSKLKEIIPEDRRWAYPVREIIECLADTDTYLELKKNYGRSVITGFIRIEGQPIALLASDCQQLGGAIDSEASEKAADFLKTCNDHKLPVLVLVDTPGFMVGPDSEEQGAVRRMASLFKVGSQLDVPITAVFLRKGYGLGAQAMVGGSLHDPIYTVAWPTAEFGGMGLEGAVKLGFKKELEAESDDKKREDLFNQLVAEAYDRGKAIEAATHLEIDAVIDPEDTRSIISKAITMSLNQTKD